MKSAAFLVVKCYSAEITYYRYLHSRLIPLISVFNLVKVTIIQYNSRKEDANEIVSLGIKNFR